MLNISAILTGQQTEFVSDRTEPLRQLQSTLLPAAIGHDWRGHGGTGKSNDDYQSDIRKWELLEHEYWNQGWLTNSAIVI